VYRVNAYSRMRCSKAQKAATGTVPLFACRVGTAIPLAEKGYLITTHCVVRKAEEVTVVTRQGDELPAVVVGTDKVGRIDIAVLKIAEHLEPPFPSMTAWENIYAGNEVIMLGKFPNDELNVKIGTVNNVIDSDVTLLVSLVGRPGTSGTPVFSTDESIMGFIAYHMRDREGEEQQKTSIQNYYVVPLEFASIIARSIINREESGSGWLGVTIPMKDTRQPGQQGVPIEKIIPESPAAGTGLKPKDCIIEFNGARVSTLKDMIEATTLTRAGDSIRIKVIRDNNPLSFDVTLSPHP